MIKYRIAFLGKDRIYYWDNTKKEWSKPLYATTTAEHQKAVALLEDARRQNAGQEEEIILDAYMVGE